MKKIENKIDTSKRRTPWDNSKQSTPIEKYIRNNYHKQYDLKHVSIDKTNDYIVFNSVQISECRYCSSKNIIKKGKTKANMQRYYCKDCKRYFNPTTNTIFENHKLSLKQWMEFLTLILDYGSIQIISRINKTSINTTRYWLIELFNIIENNQNDIKLKGKVYLDETYYTVSKDEMTYKNGKKLKGISRNKYCIAIAYDGTNIIAKVVGKGKPTEKKIYDLFVGNIEEGSTLIHDGEKAHIKLVNELSLNSITYKTNETKNLKDKDNPLNPINHQCFLIKAFLKSHSGFDRKYIQDYCNLYAFISSGKYKYKKLEKIDKLMNLSITTKVNIKYDDVFNSKKSLGALCR